MHGETLFSCKEITWEESRVVRRAICRPMQIQHIWKYNGNKLEPLCFIIHRFPYARRSLGTGTRAVLWVCLGWQHAQAGHSAHPRCFHGSLGAAADLCGRVGSCWVEDAVKRFDGASTAQLSGISMSTLNWSAWNSSNKKNKHTLFLTWLNPWFQWTDTFLSLSFW